MNHDCSNNRFWSFVRINLGLFGRCNLVLTDLPKERNYFYLFSIILWLEKVALGRVFLYVYIYVTISDARLSKTQKKGWSVKKKEEHQVFGRLESGLAPLISHIKFFFPGTVSPCYMCVFFYYKIWTWALFSLSLFLSIWFFVKLCPLSYIRLSLYHTVNHESTFSPCCIL